ncbi:ABC transporter ATP-binding protein [Massilia sp. GER05]|uniref:ABC transporter ATP-binding protein n=1 Tax=Massilia sp. GER05 TaxID=3394605 RepID=UPI003F829540
MNAVVLKNISKSYLLDDTKVSALENVNLNIRANCFTVIAGASGSGKTTLLNMIGCIDTPDHGEVIIAGQSVREMPDNVLSDFRARHLGFVFQNFNLLPVLSAYENVEYPLFALKIPKAERRARVLDMLAAVGLEGKASARPNQLSGGQRQRVAIARALVHFPKVVIADEPTANLDTVTGAAIIDLMRTMQRTYKVACIFSSHDPQVLAAADDAIQVKDGRIVSVARAPSEQTAVA